MKILLLEDDLILAESLKDLLEEENYEVDLAKDAQEAYKKTFENKYDLYIFDINLPDENGIEVLKNLKNAQDNTPSIYISALTDIKTISQAFEAGAEDYIKKPFDIEEFLIRVKSKLKTKLVYKDIELDVQKGIIKKNSKIIQLGETQFKIISALLQNRKNIVSKEELLEYMEHPNDNALRVAINKLKHKLNIDIKSVRGKGYMIE